MFFDPLYLMLMIPVFILSAYSSFKVKSNFKKYNKIMIASGKTGAEVARIILSVNGLSHVSVVETTGFLSDHYDPTKKVVRLSPDVYRNSSIASVGVAAHETGHAIQHAKAYGPLALRNLMVPIASIGSNFAWIIIMVGFFFQMMGMVHLGIILFSAVVFFQVVTLPVEFDASSRAKKILPRYNIVSASELKGVNTVLNSAAMTYVAAAASSIVTLIYFLLKAGILGGDE